MRILAVSLAPLFAGAVQGGSQRILLNVVDALAEAGHEVRVLCSDAGDAYATSHGASVEPVLQLRGSFPAQYQTAPHRLTSVWRTLQAAAEKADRAYFHADAIYMRSAIGGIPMIRSLHDFVYEEALLSAFTLAADRTIVPSSYLAECVRASAGQVADVGELVVIPNGIETPSGIVAPRLPQGVTSRKPGDLILLHPHRLQPEKGIIESARIAVEVQRLLPERRVRLLAPTKLSGDSGDDAELKTVEVTQSLREVGAGELVEFHDWLDIDEMPAYLAAGDMTLCPGSFVESFGLVPVESVVVGTPALCSRVGALRDHEGIPGIYHFDPGDTASAAAAVVAAVSAPAISRDAISSMASRFDLGSMKQAYVDAITGPLDRNAAPLNTGSSPQEPGWKLAPWCYGSGDMIYHDYLARFERFPELASVVAAQGDRLPDAVLSNSPLAEELERAKRLGFVVER